jgi:hypothetical protein
MLLLLFRTNFKCHNLFFTQISINIFNRVTLIINLKYLHFKNVISPKKLKDAHNQIINSLSISSFSTMKHNPSIEVNKCKRWKMSRYLVFSYSSSNSSNISVLNLTYNTISPQPISTIWAMHKWTQGSGVHKDRFLCLDHNQPSSM